MEIEKKYLIKNLPENLNEFDKYDIEQYYLSSSPVIRIRKMNDLYILTYKSRVEKDVKLNISNEVELPLNKESFDHLKKKADGIGIIKERYIIPYGKFKIELDVFHGNYEGFVLAEVEFKTVEEAKEFNIPSWFGEDVSGDYHYTNNYMSKQK